MLLSIQQQLRRSSPQRKSILQRTTAPSITNSIVFCFERYYSINYHRTYLSATTVNTRNGVDTATTKYTTKRFQSYNSITTSLLRVCRNHHHHHHLYVPQHPIQGSRSFGKLLRKKGKKHGYTYDECKLQICYSEYDIRIHDDDFDEDIEHLTFLRVPFDLNSIKETVEEVFDDSRDLQYYDKLRKVWKPLRDLTTPTMQKYRGGDVVLRVRVPLHYDDSVPVGPMYGDSDYENDGYSSDDYDDEGNPTMKRIRKLRRRKKDKMKDINRNSVNAMSMAMELAIKKLVSKLKEHHFVRSDGVIYNEDNTTKIFYTLTNTKTKQKIMTYDWVMEQILLDPTLQQLVISRCNAVQHIVQCIHYPILWEYEPPSPRLHTGFRRKY